jgi:hypothetical protein
VVDEGAAVVEGVEAVGDFPTIRQEVVVGIRVVGVGSCGEIRVIFEFIASGVGGVGIGAG